MSSEIESFIHDVFGWPGRIRPDTFDLTAIKEIYVEDVYRAGHKMQGAHVLDLGANVGVFSVWAAQKGATVVALECCAESYALLQANVAASGLDRITTRNAAVGPSDGTCEATFLGDTDAHKSYATPGQGGTIMQSLDRLAEEAGPKGFDVVKVDVEGMEWEMFASASRQAMERFGYITIEFHGTDAPGSAPQPEGAFGDLVAKLSETHCVQTLGAGDKGGFIYADRY